eukprot:10689729-Lingulodinium_polyedra.AAC.1
MLQQVTEDKRRLRASGKKLGPVYWNQVRAKYHVDNLDEHLVIKHPEEPPDAEPIKALEQCRSPNASKRSRSMLSAWLSTVRAINQTSFCGLCKHCVKLSLANPNSQQLLMNLM